MTYRTRFGLILLSLFLSAFAGPSRAAIIGPTWDWKPITELAEEQGISDDMVADILAAGLNLTCDGTERDNPGTLNAWLLSSDGLATTNAHGFYDELGRAREPLGDCYVQGTAPTHSLEQRSNLV